MAYVIYSISGAYRVGPTENGHPHSGYAKAYKTRGAALRTMRSFNARVAPDLIGPGPYGVTSSEDFHARVARQVTKVNLMSGKEYQESSDTPGYCSPSSEAYWSM